MKCSLLLISLLGSSLLNALLAAPPLYVTTPDGVIIFTDPQFTGTTNAVKLEVIADNIIRVIAAPGKNITARESLITVYHKKTDLVWNVIPGKENITLKTKDLTVIVDLKTGAVSFRDRLGNKILGEKQPAGRQFQPAVFEGKRSYHLTQ